MGTILMLVLTSNRTVGLSFKYASSFTVDYDQNIYCYFTRYTSTSLVKAKVLGKLPASWAWWSR